MIVELVDVFLKCFFHLPFYLVNYPLVIVVLVVMAVVVVVGTNLNWSNRHVLRSESGRLG